MSRLQGGVLTRLRLYITAMLALGFGRHTSNGSIHSGQYDDSLPPFSEH